MNAQPTRPTLHMPRLTLRPFELADAARLTSLAGTREVAATTLRVPHPYPPDAAAAWIARHAQQFEAGAELTLAITLTATGELVGSIGLVLDAEHGLGKLGYLIGHSYWNKGYATEATRELLRYGFGELRLNRVYAEVFAGNDASSRVLTKCGMRLEGRLRQHVRKWGQYIDILVYGILAEEFAAAAQF